MDERGFAPFAALGNVANRARVTLDEARNAIEILEGPDPESSDPENEGRRLERVPGGWIVLNAEKHRDLVTRAVKQAQTAERVRRFRDRKRTSNAAVTQSEAYSEAITEEEATDIAPSALLSENADFEAFRQAYPASRRIGGKAAARAWKTATSNRPTSHMQTMFAALEQHKRSEQWQTPKLIPLMTTWLNQERWNQTLPEPRQFGVTPKTAGNAAALARFAARKS